MQIDDGDDLENSLGGMIETDLSGDANDQDLDLGDMEIGTEPVTTETPAPVAKPTPAPTPAPATVTPQTPTPVAQPAPAVGSQPTAQPQQPQDFEAYVRQNMEPMVKSLAEGSFALSKEEAEAMGDAAPHVSRLLARSHLISTVQMFKALRETLPTVVGQLVKLSRDGAQHEDAFFTAHPEFKGTNRNQLASIANVLRANNPTLTASEFMPLLARTAAAAMGITMAPVRAKATPFVPAANRGGGAPRKVVSTTTNNKQGNALFDLNDALRSGLE